MTEQQIKQLLTSEVSGAAPDKQALWKKIEGRLQPKETSAKSAPIRRNPYAGVVKVGGAIAACVVLMLALPIMFGGGVISADTASGITNSMAAEENSFAEDMTDGGVSDKPNSAGDMGEAVDSPDGGSVTVPVKEFLSYSELEFDSYSETRLTCSGEPHGESYFVEEELIAQADNLVRAEVMDVYLSDDGDSIMYDLWVSENFGGPDGEITVASCSAYPMRRGREYLLLLKQTEDGWQTLFDGVPQPEFDSSWGLVFYSGWKHLITEDCVPLEYPKSGEEDFFYDCMLYSPSGYYRELVYAFDPEWEELDMIAKGQ